MASWKASSDDLVRAITHQNPWWDTGEVPDSLALPTERPLVAGVTAAVLAGGRYQVILGPRRVGKTTAMYQTARRLMKAGIDPGRVWWIRVDHPLLIDTDLGSIVSPIIDAAHLDAHSPGFLFLDELVYAKDWDRWLKTFYDEQWPFHIVASSSAAGALRRQHSESGVGRWDERFLTPYMLNEYLDLSGHAIDTGRPRNLGEAIRGVARTSIDMRVVSAARRELLFTGGFPELLVRFRDTALDSDRLVESQRVLRADAVERAVYKDIPQSFGVENPMQLERLLYAAAGQAAGLLSPRSLAGQLSMTEPTIDKYLSYFERSFITFTLPNFGGTEVARQRRGRKLYFYDGAIRNAALERGLAPLSDPVEMGVLHENMSASHLRCLSHLTAARCYHWRDGTDEIDLVYDDPGDPHAFEIATTRSHRRRGLIKFVEKNQAFHGRAWLVAVGSPFVDAATASNGIGEMSLDHFLLAAGALLQARYV